MDYPGVVKGKLDSDNIEIYEEINSKFVKNISILNEENRPDVTGGLLNKIECALEISKICECWISGFDNLKDCLENKPKGTKVIV
jgi:isopentenyl phosphate kinase